MRSLATILALLFISNTAAAADIKTGQLICGLVKGEAVAEKITDIICEEMSSGTGHSSCTEFTNVELKVKGLKMSVQQVFEKISIEVTDSKGKELLSFEGENNVTVNLGPINGRNSINAGCVIVRKEK